MKIEFISSFAPIVASPAEARPLYTDALGLELEPAAAEAEYFHSEKIDGCKHFGVWPLADAAQACFGTRDWPADRKVPQASIEFEVADTDAVAAASAELEAAGYAPLHEPRTEPWGQTVARVQAADGLIVGISHAPWMHG